MTHTSHSKARTAGKSIQQLDDSEIVSLMRGPSLIASVRSAFYSGCAEMEQGEQQRQRPSVIENRRREFLIAQRIIDIVLSSPEQILTASDAERYRYLRDRDLETVHTGGIFAGRTPESIVLNGDDLDEAIDSALASLPAPQVRG